VSDEQRFFWSFLVSTIQDGTRRNISEEIEGIEPNKFLNTNSNDLASCTLS
jgi:hypothetical protein